MLGKLISQKLLLKFNDLFLSTVFTVLILLSCVTFGINWILLSQIFVTPESCMSKNKLTLYLVLGHLKNFFFFLQTCLILQQN